jgi:hypothetical protein
LKRKERVMTAVQMNAEILRNMSIIAEDERLMNRVAKYLRKLVAEKEDPTLLTKEEFLARIDKAKEGPAMEFTSVEELDKYIRAL